MHKYKVGQTLLSNVKSLKYKDKPVKVSEALITEDDQLYYKVTGEGIFGAMSVWEHELKETA